MGCSNSASPAYGEMSWFCCGASWGPCGSAGGGACGNCNSGSHQCAWPDASAGCFNITRPHQCGESLARRTCGHVFSVTSQCSGRLRQRLDRRLRPRHQLLLRRADLLRVGLRDQPHHRPDALRVQRDRRPLPVRIDSWCSVHECWPGWSTRRHEGQRLQQIVRRGTGSAVRATAGDGRFGLGRREHRPGDRPARRTKTRKGSGDPAQEANLARIEHATTGSPDRAFA
jgi:hypothetical protein